MEPAETPEMPYEVSPELIRNTRAFIRSLCEQYGHTDGLAVWDRVREVLGDRAAGDIFLGMLTTADSLITISNVGQYKIDLIKEIRALTGWGLKESKDFVDAVDTKGPQIIDGTLYDTAKVAAFTDALRRFGCQYR